MICPHCKKEIDIVVGVSTYIETIALFENKMEEVIDLDHNERLRCSCPTCKKEIDMSLLDQDDV